MGRIPAAARHGNPALAKLTVPPGQRPDGEASSALSETELVHRTRFRTRRGAKAALFDTSRSSTTGNAAIRAWGTEHQRRQRST